MLTATTPRPVHAPARRAGAAPPTRHLLAGGIEVVIDERRGTVTISGDRVLAVDRIATNCIQVGEQ